MLKTKICTIVILSFLTLITWARQYTVAQIPDPKKQGQHQYVGNPDGILTYSEVEELNQIAKRIEATGKVEYAIVVINDFTAQDDDFNFAYTLFNTWGIGKKGANNGLLLLVAKDRRRYRFITGSGIEGLLPDVRLKQIGERALVPDFKEGNYGQGIIAASKVIEQILSTPDGVAELNSILPKSPTFIDRNSTNLIAIIVVILAYLGLFKFSKRIVPKANRAPKNILCLQN